MLAHALLPLLVFKHGFIQICFGILDFFCFCFMSNKHFLILLNFTQYLFSVNTIFLLMRNITRWMLDTKVKVFMKVFHVSWNVSETVFHEMLPFRNFVKFTGKHLCQSLFSNKVAGLRSGTLLKKGL